jgi:hypothetical protein
MKYVRYKTCYALYVQMFLWILPCQKHITVPWLHALRKFALRHFVRTNFYNEAHTLGLACRPNQNWLIRNSS